MRRVTLVVLAVLVPVAGCLNPHARRPAAVYRPGADKPTTVTVPYDASYGLTPLHRDGTPMLTVYLEHNEQIGFQQLPDGPVVALAGRQVFPLADGEFAWVLVPGSDGSWSERAGQDREQFRKGVKDAVSFVTLLPFMLVLGLGKGCG